MRTRGAAILASLLLFGGTACVHVGSSVAGQQVVNGEAWYVKTTSFWGITFSTSVFYCPPSPETRGPQSCVEAVMHDESQLAAVPAPAPETWGGGRPRDGAKKRKKARQRDEDEDDAADEGDDDDDGKTEDRPPKDEDAADDEKRDTEGDE